MWLTYGNDKDPGALAAAAGMAVRGNGVDSSIMNYVDPWDRAIAGVNQDVQEHLKRKQLKEIADMQNQQQMAELEQKQSQFEQGQGLRDAQIGYYNRRDGGGNAGKFPVQLADGTTVYVTGNELLKNERIRLQHPPQADMANADTPISKDGRQWKVDGKWVPIPQDVYASMAAERDVKNNPPPAPKPGTLKWIMDKVTGGGVQPTLAPSQPAPTTDKEALAREALNDPEATEEDKLRARKILGMP